MAHPYDELTPDVVLDALDAVGLRPDGRLFALGSYENRVYQVGLDEPVQGHAQVVAKFYRPGRWSDEAIAQEHAFARELADAEVPVVAPLELQGRTLHAQAGFRYAISPRRGGRAPELDDPDVLEWIGRLLARLHCVGERQAFDARETLDATTFGHAPMQWLLTNDAIALDAQGRWQRACTAALARVEVAYAAHPPRLLRAHGDCHAGNILWTPDAGPHFVDLDDARMAPAVQDLWMLLSGERDQRQRQLVAMIDGYEQVREFDRRELALIEPLRTLRLVHYSAWLARRWDDPAFPRAFPWFGSSDYWMGQAHQLEEQLEAMDDPPLVA